MSPVITRPKSLAEVAQRVLSGHQWRIELADFLDEFYDNPAAEKLSAEPIRLFNQVERGLKRDAYLAAVAEHLWRKYAKDYDIPYPRWADAPERVLAEPSFSYQTREGRLYLLCVSPPAFKSRNLFVPEDVLVRC